MTTKRPIPIPTGRDLLRWATGMVDYLRALEANIDTPGPKIIQLEHQKNDPSAAVDGLLMFDPLLRGPTYSEGGAWHPLTGGGLTHVKQEVISVAQANADLSDPPNNTLLVGRGVTLSVDTTRVLDYRKVGSLPGVYTDNIVGIASSGVESVTTGSMPLQNDALGAARSFWAIIFGCQTAAPMAWMSIRSAVYLLEGPVKGFRVRGSAASNITGGTISWYAI